MWLHETRPQLKGMDSTIIDNIGNTCGIHIIFMHNNGMLFGGVKSLTMVTNIIVNIIIVGIYP